MVWLDVSSLCADACRNVSRRAQKVVGSCVITDVCLRISAPLTVRQMRALTLMSCRISHTSVRSTLNQNKTRNLLWKIERFFRNSDLSSFAIFLAGAFNKRAAFWVLQCVRPRFVYHIGPCVTPSETNVSNLAQEVHHGKMYCVLVNESPNVLSW